MVRKTSLSDFYIGSVDNTLSGFQYVDEQTNETYTMTFGDENSLFESRIGSRHQNFTWSSGNDSLMPTNLPRLCTTYLRERILRSTKCRIYIKIILS